MNAVYMMGEAASVSTRQRVRAMALTAISLAALLYLRLFNPVGSGLYPPCIFYKATGLYCPGCGSTRALYQLVHGHLAAAFAMNPLLVLALPFIAYWLLSHMLVALRGRGLPKIFVNPAIIKLLFWLVVAFGLLRNLPVYPFNLLAPHTL